MKFRKRTKKKEPRHRGAEWHEERKVQILSLFFGFHVMFVMIPGATTLVVANF